MLDNNTQNTAIRLIKKYHREITPWYFTVAATIIISAFCVFVDYTYTKTTVSPLLMDSPFILTLRALTIAVLLDYTPLPLSYIIHKNKAQCEKKGLLVGCLLTAWFATFISYLLIAYATRMSLLSTTVALSGMHIGISSDDKFKAFCLFINSGITPACTSLLSFTVSYVTYNPAVQEKIARATLISKASREQAVIAAAQTTAMTLLEKESLDTLRKCLDNRAEAEKLEIEVRGDEYRSMNGYVINDHLSNHPDSRSRLWAAVVDAVKAERNDKYDAPIKVEEAGSEFHTENKIHPFPAANSISGLSR